LPIRPLSSSLSRHQPGRRRNRRPHRRPRPPPPSGRIARNPLHHHLPRRRHRERSKRPRTSKPLSAKIRTTLTDASRRLGRIDYRSLSVEGKAQYDIAKRFVEQAEEALVAKNLLFASQLADKASVLAALLTK